MHAMQAGETLEAFVHPDRQPVQAGGHHLVPVVDARRQIQHHDAGGQEARRAVGQHLARRQAHPAVAHQHLPVRLRHRTGARHGRFVVQVEQQCQARRWRGRLHADEQVAVVRHRGQHAQRAALAFRMHALQAEGVQVVDAVAVGRRGVRRCSGRSGHRGRTRRRGATADRQHARDVDHAFGAIVHGQAFQRGRVGRARQRRVAAPPCIARHHLGQHAGVVAMAEGARRLREAQLHQRAPGPDIEGRRLFRDRAVERLVVLAQQGGVESDGAARGQRLRRPFGGEQRRARGALPLAVAQHGRRDTEAAVVGRVGVARIVRGKASGVLRQAAPAQVQPQRAQGLAGQLACAQHQVAALGRQRAEGLERLGRVQRPQLVVQ